MAAVTEAVFLAAGWAFDAHLRAARKETHAVRGRPAIEFQLAMGALIAGGASSGSGLSASSDTPSAVFSLVAVRSVSALAATEQASSKTAIIASAAEALFASIAEITLR